MVQEISIPLVFLNTAMLIAHILYKKTLADEHLAQCVVLPKCYQGSAVSCL